MKINLFICCFTFNIEIKEQKKTPPEKFFTSTLQNNTQLQINEKYLDECNSLLIRMNYSYQKKKIKAFHQNSMKNVTFCLKALNVLD